MFYEDYMRNGGMWLDTVTGEKELLLNKQEVKDLLKFIYDNGYISHEFHEPIYALKNRLEEFIKDNE